MADLQSGKKSIDDVVPPGIIQITLRTQFAENKLKAYDVVQYEGHFFKIHGSPVDKSDGVRFRKICNAHLQTNFDQKHGYLSLNTLDLYG